MKILTALILALTTLQAAASKPIRFIDLKGGWTVALDSLDNGIDAGYTSSNLPDTITLPGTTDMAGLGTPNTLKPVMDKPQLLHLTRKHSYIGPAWYSRTVEIPVDMADKPLDLTLERVLWSSELWIDGVKQPGINESLTTPHRFRLPNGLSAGTHRITLRIDNRKRHDISVKELAHSYTEDTQTKWNGVLGRMQLAVRPEAAITSLQVFPDIHASTARLVAEIFNSSRKAKTEAITFSIYNNDSQPVSTEKKLRLQPGKNVVEATLPIADAKLWSEFSPTLYTAEVATPIDSISANFGMREIATDGIKITLNGKPVFLRGTLECCIFPLTGTPPTTTSDWQKVFSTAREWGLNHLRFHSWCPPEAAFHVADSMGFYLQVELPFWSESLKPADTSVKAFLHDEALRILREYGNHPSFCMLSNGNEIRHDFEWLNAHTAYLKQLDSRRLYTTSTFTFEPDHGLRPEPADDYFVTQWTADGWVRGQGVFDSEPPTFKSNYASAMKHVDKPLIQHESGQYAVYPSMHEIDKYTGILDPLNFKAIRNDLERKGLLHLADTFTMASGRFAALLYKEDIERAMKTPGFSGYQLLGLQDFPGQGTALVGLVDAFWDSKGVETPQNFSRFVAPVVPFASFEKAVYSDNEPFIADIELFNYSPESICDASLSWSLSTPIGELASGRLHIADAPNGEITSAGKIMAELKNLDKPTRLTLYAALDGTPYANSWQIWYYPEIKEITSGNVIETSDIVTALKALKDGDKVLYSPLLDSIHGLECKFLPVFWSPVHFPKQAAGMGIYTDPNHPALASFPTDMHTNWQWWHPLKHATTLELDSLSSSLKASERLMPIVGIVDNFVNNRNLGLIAEAQCGNGTIIISAIDLLSADVANRPEIKWLRQSLLNYMNSPDFTPAISIDADRLKALQSVRSNTRTSAESIYQ